MNQFLKKIQNSIVNAYIRQSGYRLSIEKCKDILSRTSFSTYEEREDKMLGYTVYRVEKNKVYTEIHYEGHESLIKTAMILTHEIGHAIVAFDPLIEKEQVIFSKRALVEEGENKTGDYMTEGFLEEISDQIWKDSLFLLELRQIGIAGVYTYKDPKIFPFPSYYEEYKILYRLSNALLRNSLFLDAFAPTTKRMQKELPISYIEWNNLYEEACESLETLFKKEVRDSKVVQYYFEEYFYKKDQLCEKMREIYKVKEEEYNEEEKRKIETLFNLYIQNIEALSSLPFTEEQKRKYSIKEKEKKQDIKEIVKEMPKVELHLHLDGSVRKETMIEILNRKIKKEEISIVQREDLNAYLTKFSVPISCMQAKENLKRIASELVIDLEKENVIYAEIRFAPFKHTKNIAVEEVVESVLEGLYSVPAVETKLILCMMRGDDLEDCKRVIDLAYHYLKRGVVAVDLAGAEALYKTETYSSAFAYAREKGVPFTIHAGEADGCESIASSLSFGSKRIGHGIRILDCPSLLQRVRENKILFEVCPTSNMHTIPTLEYGMHPIYTMYKKGLCVCINTDNRTVSDVTLTEEYLHLLECFPFKIEDFMKMNEMAIDGAFVSTIEKERLKEKLHLFKLS